MSVHGQVLVVDLVSLHVLRCLNSYKQTNSTSVSSFRCNISTSLRSVGSQIRTVLEVEQLQFR